MRGNAHSRNLEHAFRFLCRRMRVRARRGRDHKLTTILAAERAGECKLRSLYAFEDFAARSDAHDLAAKRIRGPHRALAVGADAIRDDRRRILRKLRPDATVRERAVGRKIESRETGNEA